MLNIEVSITQLSIQFPYSQKMEKEFFTMSTPNLLKNREKRYILSSLTIYVNVGLIKVYCYITENFFKHK